jgi:16S rRNA (guanine(966)-N(2))-methyltransferase RsmD
MLKTPSGDRTRPTAAQLRQALFNSIQAQVPDARVLDLFAGSGALGFEALSRGAAHATFVELSRAVSRLITDNARELKAVDRTRVSNSSCDDFLAGYVGEPFDLVLVDPPYEAGWELKVLEFGRWSELLVPEGLLCLEWGALKSQVTELPDRASCLVKIREKKYGDSRLTTYIREA